MCFALYGSWEVLDGCKILPRGVGMICPYFWEICFFTRHMCLDIQYLLYYYMCFETCSLSSMFETKCYRQNDRSDRVVISWFSWTHEFDSVLTRQINVCNATPNLLSVCIMDILRCVIYIYIYILLCCCFSLPTIT